MTVVRRTDGEQILKDHEQRIRALERSPGASSVYVDSRVLEAAADHVLFDSFPSGRTILEVSWLAILDATAVADPCFAGLLLNGDAVNNEIGHEGGEYRWNVAIPDSDMLGAPFTSANEDDYFNDYGVISWITTGYASWGRLRFPGYNLPDALDGSAGYSNWVGDAAVGESSSNGSNPGVCSGGADSSGDLAGPLTALSLIATNEDGFTLGDRQPFAAGSWFALTAY